MKRIITIIGARPQFIKASVVSKIIAESNFLEEIIIHTGQHYDPQMSDLFFTELNIPKPKYFLNINRGNHGEMTGRMLIEIEKILIAEKPDYAMVYGDTNSTLAGALAASKLHIPIIHIEAGLRSFNMQMPEEINRVLTDQISSILFCPTHTAIDNLKKEGFDSKKLAIYKVGDVMQDSALLFSTMSKKPKSAIYDKNFILTTIHRAENTDNPDRLKSIIEALNEIHINIMPVILPIHPRTQKLIQQLKISTHMHIIEPVGYLEMLWLLEHCKLVATDSGGLQKEAFFFRKPCVTIRDQTEWIELLDIGANVLVRADKEQIIHSIQQSLTKTITDNHNLYGGGSAAQNIIDLLLSTTTSRSPI